MKLRSHLLIPRLRNAWGEIQDWEMQRTLQMTSYWHFDTFLLGVIKLYCFYIDSLFVENYAPIPFLYNCIDASPRRSSRRSPPRCNFFFRAEVFLLTCSVSPSIVEHRSEGILVEERDPESREKCLSSSPVRSRTDFRRNDARGISNSIARDRCTCLRKRISARVNARKGFDHVQLVVSSLSLSLFRSPFFSLSCLPRYICCTCRCNLNSVKSGISWSPVATVVVIIAIVVVVIVVVIVVVVVAVATIAAMFLVATGAPGRLNVCVMRRNYNLK